MKKYYFISKFDTNIIDKQDKQTSIIYRNYNSKIKDQDLILKIKNYCKKNSIEFYLSNDIRLALKLNLDGAYIPSFNNCLKHLAYSLKKNSKLLVLLIILKKLGLRRLKKFRKFLYHLFLKKIKTSWELINLKN